jgi:hypothetical protein
LDGDGDDDGVEAMKRCVDDVLPETISILEERPSFILNQQPASSSTGALSESFRAWTLFIIRDAAVLLAPKFP